MTTPEEKKAIIAAYKAKKDIGGICKITNMVNGKVLLIAAPNLEGAQSRFSFSQNIGSCFERELQSDWKEYGASSFSFEVVEELEKLPEQTTKEFRNDLKELLVIWKEKMAETLTLY